MKRLTLQSLTVVLLLSTLSGLAQAQDQRFVRFESNGNVHWGELQGSTIHQLTEAPYLDGERTGMSVQREDVMLRAPVDPQLVVMTAFNFRSHISGEPADYPGLFIVPPNSIIGPDEDIVRPAGSDNLHYEAEMVAVIGERARDVPLEEAHEYVFGVTAGNDVSERAWQGQDLQWTRAKGTDSFNAVGPELVTGLDYTNLAIEGRLNGERRQGENSSDLIFDINYMVSYISRYFTLEPGDLIWSGTMGSTEAMEPGDEYAVEVEGVGVLRNTVVQEPDM